MRVAVVIPAFRVAGHIEKVIRAIPELVSEIIVVDDASPDDTAQIVSDLGDPRVHLLRHEHNGGVGAAMITGYRLALELGADIVVKMDGDDQMDPQYLVPLIEPLLSGAADYTKGSRFFFTRQLRKMPRLRRVGNLALSFLTKASSGYWDVFDPTNGYTAVHRGVLEVLDWSNVDRRWFFETSILIELSLARAVVRDVQIPAKYADERSSLSEVRAVFRFPAKLLAAFFRRIWLQYFVREFTPVSLFLVAGLFLSTFGTVWGMVHWVRSGQTGVEASTGTVMIAVVPLILGVQLLLQAVSLDIQGTPKVPLSSSPRRWSRPNG
ncbi:MAG TPA: glycosyltransferase family 2 protein [Thermoanaerobaculia bacterium]|nr:glycosyltransferase family 2 protein [Thermoanaerobaculia bacterium]